MEHLYPLVGGAERSVDALMRELVRRGHTVDYLCASNYSEQALAPARDADAIVTQLRWSAEATRLARMLGKPSAMFVRSYENLCGVSSNAEVISHCGQRCSVCPHRVRPAIQADRIFANSKFTQRFLQQEHGLSSEVLYPFIDFAAVKAEPGLRRYITMNQFAYHKGADIFLRLAARLPKLSFRVVGYSCWNPTVPVPPNVVLTGPLDPRSYYRDTLVFLAPGRWAETFGRSMVEARYNGIPVIATDRGAAHVDGIVSEELRIADADDLVAWERTLLAVLESYPVHAEQARCLNFDQYSVAHGTDIFEQSLHALLRDHRQPAPDPR